jgi:hypothetical protein
MEAPCALNESHLVSSGFDEVHTTSSAGEIRECSRIALSTAPPIFPVHPVNASIMSLNRADIEFGWLLHIVYCGHPDQLYIPVKKSGVESHLLYAVIPIKRYQEINHDLNPIHIILYVSKRPLITMLFGNHLMTPGNITRFRQAAYGSRKCTIHVFITKFCILFMDTLPALWLFRNTMLVVSLETLFPYLTQTPSPNHLRL